MHTANKPDPQFLFFVAHHKVSTYLKVDTSCITALKGKRCGEIRAYHMSACEAFSLPSLAG
jgi:hypothetical protein